MSNLPRKAPPKIREQIVDALSDPERRFLDSNSSSRSFLDHWDLSEDGFFSDLREGLEDDERLFLKPKTNNNDPQRYQCVLAYPEEVGLPAVDIHVTLFPRGKPPRVKVAVHPSDTAQTLPKIAINSPDSDEDHSTSET